MSDHSKFAADRLPPKDGFIVDLDGTLIAGGAALPHARALFEHLTNRFVIVSNDAEHVPAQVAAMLGSLGLPVRPDRIVLAGVYTLDLIAAERPQAKVLLCASSALEDYAAHLGLRLVAEAPDVVVIGRDRRFSYAKLAAAANAVHAGAELVAANADRLHPGPRGTVVPETGALLAAVQHCVGPRPCRVIGKPEPALFAAALRILGVPAGRAAVIGDNPETDGVGAGRLGMHFVDIRNWAAAEAEDAARLSCAAHDGAAMLEVLQ